MAFEPLEARRLLAVLTVNSLADNSISGDGFVTLREAIHAANTDGATDLQHVGNGADEIRFAAALNGGTILLSGGELQITQALSIDATALASGLTINGQRQSRIFNITAESGNFTIAGLTLTRGRTTDALAAGGAIRSATEGTLTIADSSISGNHTEGINAVGGGIFARGDVIITNSDVTGNHTEGENAEGGGIHSLRDVVLVNSTVSGNFTRGENARGGGLYASGTVTLDRSHVRVNHTIGTFSAGAGIAAGSPEIALGAVNLFNSTVSGNFTVGSSAHGAGIAAWGPVAILHSDVIYNIAFNPLPVGGGVWTQNDPIGIINSIVALNSTVGGSPDIRPGGALNVSYSLIGNNLGTQLIAAPVGSPDANGNLIGTAAAPIDPLVGQHADNGGPTLTHALLPGSPAIDAGNPNAVASGSGMLQFDQRGAGFTRVSNSRIDMGAFEVQVPDPDPVPTVISFPLLSGPITKRETVLESPLLAGPTNNLLLVRPIAERTSFPESDGGSGGGIPMDEDSFGPRANSDAERALRELLSRARIATREEVIDAVYSLGDIERVSLVGFDMGDEPLAARKKPDRERESGEAPSEIIVNKPPIALAPPEDSGWGPLAIWSALAGGGTLWMGGAWWWAVRNRRRSIDHLPS